MILLWVSLLVVFLDRITKMAVVSKMTEGDSIPVFENIFHITYVLNPGAAFGMLPHNRMFFLAIGVAAVSNRNLVDAEGYSGGRLADTDRDGAVSGRYPGKSVGQGSDRTGHRLF